MKLFVAFALMLAAQAGHTAYPERPITLIVAYPPGGGTDLIARALAPYVEKNLGGAKIVIVNRAGAGGEVGFAALAAAPADGYTIGFVNTPPLLTIPIERPAQFTWQRFDYIGNIIDDPCKFLGPQRHQREEPGRAGRLRQGQSRRGHGRHHRDRLRRPPRDAQVRARRGREDAPHPVQGLGRGAVSYTHLTLPTIYSV